MIGFWDLDTNWMLHFLANFTLPEEGEESVFKEIIFTELQREEATKLVAEYNKVRCIIFYYTLLQSFL